MTNDRDPLSLALYPRSSSGTAFNSEPAYFTFISELTSLFVDEYTVEGTALKYEFVFEGGEREILLRASRCTSENRLLLRLLRLHEDSL